VSTDITPENESFLQQTISTGVFHDRSEAINTAIELLKRRSQLIGDVNVGIEQLEQGMGKPLNVEGIMAAIDARLAAHERLDT